MVGTFACLYNCARCIYGTFPKTGLGGALWIEFINLGLALRSEPNIEGRLHHVYYERLQKNRITQIATLFHFAGLQFEDALVAEIVKRTDIEIVPNRHKGPTLHVRKGVLGDWRKHFSDDETALFKDMVGNICERVGYRLD